MELTKYHIRQPGELWVLFSDGELRRATASEEISFLGWVPDVASLIGWQGSALSGSHYLAPANSKHLNGGPNV